MKSTPQTLLSIKILSIVGFCFLVYLITNLLYLRFVSYSDVQKILKDQNNKIVSDLVYREGKWNTTGYNNDYKIPFNNPLYIITTDGFVIDRESPITGFLDTSDFTYSSSFQQPQTVTTPANEIWRMFSKVITSKSGVPIGNILVGYYQPDLKAFEDVDNQLTNGAVIIASQIKINGDTLDTSSVDVREVSVFLSFEIVDRFNHALKSVGGIPAHIDRSYLPTILKTQYQTVTNARTGEQFLVYFTPFVESKNPVGVIVSGYPLQQVNKDLQNQLVFSVGSGAVVIVILIILLGFLLQRNIASLLKKAGEAAQKVLYVSHRAGAFGFDQDTGLIYLGDKKMEVPVKTKQYYICKVLFSKPNKNWENDEIIDRLSSTGILEGSTAETADMYGSKLEEKDMRKKAKMISDAIRLVNEKAKQVFGYEVVLLQGKTYRINPNIQPQNA